MKIKTLFISRSDNESVPNEMNCFKDNNSFFLPVVNFLSFRTVTCVSTMLQWRKRRTFYEEYVKTNYFLILKAVG